MKSTLASSLLIAAGLLTTAACTHAAGNVLPVVRGKYLVEAVGQCADCHSTRNERGEFLKEFWLKGAALTFAPTVPMPVWAGVAPAIAGLPTMNDEQAVKFLMTGLKPDGTFARPPMPQYRLNEEDARAAVAYLRSLETQAGPDQAKAK